MTDIYCTSFCNQGHRLRDGKPVNHECYIIPPVLLRMEKEEDPGWIDAWWAWFRGRPIKLHKGVDA